MSALVFLNELLLAHDLLHTHHLFELGSHSARIHDTRFILFLYLEGVIFVLVAGEELVLVKHLESVRVCELNLFQHLAQILESFELKVTKQLLELLLMQL